MMRPSTASCRRRHHHRRHRRRLCACWAAAQVHDHSASGMVSQCSSGTISAVGTLTLLGLAAAEADSEVGADGAAADSSWRHVTLELQEGRAGRLAHAVESAVAGAVEKGESWEVPGAGSKRQAGNEADPKQQQAAGDVDLEAGGHLPEAGAAAAAAAAAAPGAAVPQAAASSGNGTPPQQQKQKQQEQQDGATQRDNLGHSGSMAALRSTTLTQRLSYRPLRQPLSSLLNAAQQRQAAAAALASRKSLRASRTFIRLLSMRQPSSLELGGDEVAERKQQQAAGPAGVVQEGVPVEVPLAAMPRHLHSYGHGGECAALPPRAAAANRSSERLLPLPLRLPLPLPPQWLSSPCRPDLPSLACLSACPPACSLHGCCAVDAWGPAVAGDSEEGGPLRIPQRQNVSGRQPSKAAVSGGV